MQNKPLTNEQVYEITKKWMRYHGKKEDMIVGDAIEIIVRYTEKAHGIKGDDDGK